MRRPYQLANVRNPLNDPGVLRLDHDPDRHHDRAVAMALDASYLVEQPIRSADLYASAGDDGSVPVREAFDAASALSSHLRYDEMF